MFNCFSFSFINFLDFRCQFELDFQNLVFYSYFIIRVCWSWSSFFCFLQELSERRVTGSYEVLVGLGWLCTFLACFRSKQTFYQIHRGWFKRIFWSNLSYFSTRFHFSCCLLITDLLSKSWRRNELFAWQLSYFDCRLLKSEE